MSHTSPVQPRQPGPLAVTELLEHIRVERLIDLDPQRSVRTITCDSREAKTGSLFFAIPGTATDGLRYAGQALGQGAIGVVSERATRPEGLPGAIVEDGRAAWARASAAWWRHPSREMTLIGITGTDGKTTTTSMLYDLLSRVNRQVGAITSVSATYLGREFETGLHTTTPDAYQLQALLRKMRNNGVDTVVLESTSHGLAHRRVLGCEFDVGVVTNITSDHLDFHETLSGYVEAKAMLFDGLGATWRKSQQPKIAVLNADDGNFDRLRRTTADRIVTYSVDAASEVKAENIELGEAESKFRSVTPQWQRDINLNLPGSYNIKNALAAIATAYALDADPDAIVAGLNEFRGVPGRMEPVEMGQPFQVRIDFAHTASSLNEVLIAARSMAPTSRIIVVFGCAGLRDRDKRPVMGKVASELADIVILTAEDPRTESLAAILEEIASGCSKAGGIEGESFLQIEDRADAIRHGVEIARAGDCVLICGKGHERSMCYGVEETPWSDRQAAMDALRLAGFGA